MRRLLLVEDNQSDEVLTVRELRKHDAHAEIVVARDGEEALDYLFATGAHAGRDSEELPTLVLLDLNLPKIGGLEVLQRMREDIRTQRVPVVMLTTSNEHADVARSYALGANAYVRKPVEFARFADAIRTVGAFWLGVNEPLPSREAG